MQQQGLFGTYSAQGVELTSPAAASPPVVQVAPVGGAGAEGAAAGSDVPVEGGAPRSPSVGGFMSKMVDEDLVCTAPLSL